MEPAARIRRTRFGAFAVDLRSGELYKHGIRLKLQEQPFQVLALLLEHPGEVITREELRENDLLGKKLRSNGDPRGLGFAAPGQKRKQSK